MASGREAGGARDDTSAYGPAAGDGVLVRRIGQGRDLGEVDGHAVLGCADNLPASGVHLEEISLELGLDVPEFKGLETLSLEGLGSGGCVISRVASISFRLCRHWSQRHQRRCHEDKNLLHMQIKTEFVAITYPSTVPAFPFFFQMEIHTLF